MFRRMGLVLFLLTLGIGPLRAQDKPTVLVHSFTVASGVKFPYDMTELQKRAVDELKSKNATQFDVVTAAEGVTTKLYILDGEVLEWHKGNTAERMLIAMGSVAGRENAKIHFWLSDKDGKKVYEHTDVIRQGFMQNGHEKSIGTLLHPFAEKISERLKEAKLGPESAPSQ